MAKRTSETLCRLLAAWVHGVAPEAADISDFEALFQTADRHLLSAAVCAALEQTGLMGDCPPEIAKRFREAKARSIRKTILMDAERGEILEAMDEKGIWYAPLKVAVNTVYPQYGTRRFADNDILFDAERWRAVRDIMEMRGYKAESIGKGANDVYYKPPYNFEMHRKLFLADGRRDFLSVCADYYEDVKTRLIKDEDDRCGYHFSDEDLYIYFLAHAYKHYGDSGTGLRTLLDLYLYRRAKPDLDAAYIAEEVQKLGLEDFEAASRTLTEKIFGPASPPALTEKERDMLRWVASSGAYGTAAHHIEAELRRLQNGDGPVTARTKMKYLLRRLFPEWSWYSVNAPFVYRHRWTVPFYWAYRLGRGVFVKGRRNLREAGMVCARRER